MHRETEADHTAGILPPRQPTLHSAAPTRAPAQQALSPPGWLRRRIAAQVAEWTRPAPFDWRSSAACLVGGALLMPLTRLLPVAGWDWGISFAPGHLDQYPPWSGLILTPLTELPWREGLALLNGITLCAVALGSSREARGQRLRSRLAAAALAVVSPPALILLWQGNVDGLVQFGVLSLPLGVGYLLIKPHLGLWAALARRSWAIVTGLFLLLSILIWRDWPLDLLATLPERNAHPMAMGWQNLSPALLAVGLAMLPFTRADPLHLMCVGVFVTPYLLPQHLLLLLPALGRVRGPRRLLLWGAAWTTILPAMVLTWGLYAAYSFPLLVWWLLLPARPGWPAHLPRPGRRQPVCPQRRPLASSAKSIRQSRPADPQAATGGMHALPTRS